MSSPKAPVKFVYLSEHERRKAAAGAFDWPSPPSGFRLKMSSTGRPRAMAGRDGRRVSSIS